MVLLVSVAMGIYQHILLVAAFDCLTSLENRQMTQLTSYQQNLILLLVDS